MALTVTTSMQSCKTNELRSWDTATAPLTHCTARQETPVTSPDGLKGHHMGYVVFMKHERSYNYKWQVATQAMNQVFVTFKVM
jgi:hypothetical protein